MKISDFKTKKINKEKIVMLTCYNFPSAKIASQTDVDILLVGDSVAMTEHGFENTIHATLDMMVLHTQAVARAKPKQFILSDLPFLSYRKSKLNTMQAVHQLMLAGAHGIKLEGAQGNEKIISHIVESGVPVMGHLGLTPQMFHALGGFKAQGKTTEAAKIILEDAKKLEDAGCFALVLECIPETLAKIITEQLSIPTIGIGAGKLTDGQVLVWHDVLGLNQDFLPKFSKKYLNSAEIIEKSLAQFVFETKTGAFPNDSHCF